MFNMKPFLAKQTQTLAQLTHEWPLLLKTPLQTCTPVARGSQGTSHLRVSVVLHSTHQIPGPTSLLLTSPSQRGEDE